MGADRYDRIDDLQDRYNELVARRARLLVDLDACRDGDPRRPGIERLLEAIGARIRTVEAELEAAIDELDEPGTSGGDEA